MLEARARTYRAAGRTFRFGVYRFLEVLWLGSLIVFAMREFGFIREPAWSTIAVAVAAMASIVHSLRMTAEMPWKLVISMLVGALMYGAFLLLEASTGAPIDAFAMGVLFASGHYLKTNEAWTDERAAAALNGPI